MSFGVSSLAGQFPNRELYLLISAQLRKISNPLTSQYWSQTLYALGPHVIKFSAKPVGSPPATHSALGGPDFLQDEMAVLLQTHDVNFGFCGKLIVYPLACDRGASTSRRYQPGTTLRISIGLSNTS